MTNVLVWKTIWRWKRRVSIYFQTCRIGITPIICRKRKAFWLLKPSLNGLDQVKGPFSRSKMSECRWLHTVHSARVCNERLPRAAFELSFLPFLPRRSDLLFVSGPLWAWGRRGVYLICVADVLEGGATYFSWESVPRNDPCEVKAGRTLGVSAHYGALCGPRSSPCGMLRTVPSQAAVLLQQGADLPSAGQAFGIMSKSYLGCRARAKSASLWETWPDAIFPANYLAALFSA